MNEYLLILTIGPVQDFIAQARRTRDLWFGSHVLSEISRAAAKCLAKDEECTLVFPALDRDDPDLEPCDTVRRQGGDGGMPYSVANKLVALVRADTSADVRALALAARRAAVDRLCEWGMRTFDEHQALVDTSLRELARDQLESLLQIRAAWTPTDQHRDGYPQARHAVERDLARRKTLAAFSPLPERPQGGFKSSLDGVRESVLARTRQRAGDAWCHHNIGLREELDAVGLLKRAGGRTDQFVPVPTVGLAAWLARARREHPELLQIIAEACDKARSELRAQAPGHDPYAFRRLAARQPCARPFPYDAQVMLPERWQPYFADAWQPETPREPRELADRAARFGARVQKLHSAMGKPFPYVACLVADGDRMGDAINHGRTPADHRKLSQALAAFSRDACRIIEQDHHGVLIYAGGDDVLAFIALQHAFACAAALRASFAEHLRPVVALSGSVPVPTLSVGLGVGHVIQSLGRLLTLGRDAEKLAKHARPCDRRLGQEHRDGLAVIWEKHAGTSHTWRAQADHAAPLLARSVDLFANDQLSAGKVHEIAALCRRLPASGARAEQPGTEASRVLTGEFARILSRNQSGTGALVHARRAAWAMDCDWPTFESEPYASQRARVEEWLARMCIAIELHRAHASAAIVWPAPAGELTR